jgi:hypothetical protein
MEKHNLIIVADCLKMTFFTMSKKSLVFDSSKTHSYCYVLHHLALDVLHHLALDVLHHLALDVLHHLALDVLHHLALDILLDAVCGM